MNTIHLNRRAVFFRAIFQIPDRYYFIICHSICCIESSMKSLYISTVLWHWRNESLLHLLASDMDPNQITKDIQTIFKTCIMKKSNLFLQINVKLWEGLFSNSINKEKCTPLYIQNRFAIVCSRLSIMLKIYTTRI